jgi:hypothetical protein
VTENEQKRDSDDGTVHAPRYHDGAPADVGINGDVFLNTKFYTYRTATGLVAGATLSMMFTINRPAREVWPHFKDFNTWQKGHFYNGVMGELEGRSYEIGGKPNEEGQSAWRRRVLNVVPEHLIVTSALGPVDGTAPPGLPGLGGISPGTSVFMLNEHAGKTIVTIVIAHGSYASRTPNMSIDEALKPWRDSAMVPEWQRKWRDDFIPDLKALVYGARQS